MITYDPTSGNASACSAQKVTMKINSMSDDTNQFADGTMDVATQYMPASATDATLFEDRAKLWISSNTKVGLRFPLAPLPPGVTIKSAKLRLTALGNASAQPMTVSGILNPAGNAQAFLGDLNYLDSLTLTTGDQYISHVYDTYCHTTLPLPLPRRVGILRIGPLRSFSA